MERGSVDLPADVPALFAIIFTKYKFPLSDYVLLYEMQGMKRVEAMICDRLRWAGNDPGPDKHPIPRKATP